MLSFEFICDEGTFTIKAVFGGLFLMLMETKAQITEVQSLLQWLRSEEWG